MPTISLDNYKAHLMLEKGLTSNTAQAYIADVEKLLSYMADQGLQPHTVTLDHLHRFAYTLIDLGISPVSVCRILSGVRSWFTTSSHKASSPPTPPKCSKCRAARPTSPPCSP